MLYVAGMPANESSWLKGGANTNTVNPNASSEPNTYMIARMSQSPALFSGKYDSWTTTNTNADGSTSTTTTSTANATASPITSSDAHRRANEKLESSQHSSNGKTKGRQRKQRRAANKDNHKVCSLFFQVSTAA
jgi:hypothetical protein